VRLVTFSQKHQFSQIPHNKHFKKSAIDQPEAPGTKTPQKRAWWAGFRPHQVRKTSKSAPGGQVYGQSRRKITGLSSKTALYEDGWPKIQSLSSKTALYEDGWLKFQGLSSKTALYEDGWLKIQGLSSKTALYEDELTKNLSSSTTTAPNVDGSTKRTSGAGAKGKTRQIPMFPVAMCPGNPGYDSNGTLKTNRYTKLIRKTVKSFLR